MAKKAPEASKKSAAKPAKVAKPVAGGAPAAAAKSVTAVKGEAPMKPAAASKPASGSKTAPVSKAAKPEPTVKAAATTKPAPAAKASAEAKAAGTSKTADASKASDVSKTAAGAKGAPKVTSEAEKAEPKAKGGKVEVKVAAKAGSKAAKSEGKIEGKVEAKVESKVDAAPEKKADVKGGANVKVGVKAGAKAAAKPEPEPEDDLADDDEGKSEGKGVKKPGAALAQAPAVTVGAGAAGGDAAAPAKPANPNQPPRPIKRPKAPPPVTVMPPGMGRLMDPKNPIRKPLIPSGPKAQSLRPLGAHGHDFAEAPKVEGKSPFSKKELERYRTMLIRKRAELVGDVNTMENEALRGQSGSMSNSPNHMAEQGSEAYDQALSLDLAAADRKLIREIDDALERIKDNTYGLCQVTGIPIKPERLEELPWARYSIEAARELERQAMRS